MKREPKIVRFLEGRVTLEEVSPDEANVCAPALETLAASVAQRPSEGLRDRLLASTAGDDNFSGYLERAAQMFDLSVEQTRRVLAAYQARSLPTEHPAEGIAITQVQAGPGRENCAVTITQLDPGASIPSHGHHGDEWGLVLKGHLADDLGAHAFPGDYVRTEKGSVHRVWNAGAVPCVVINVVEGGLDWSPS